ncbi:hypothetical protein P168DRAFT_323668 [Aspergillus campestris IBT 28561]|uniref:CBF1-interacting co-repressor CIR N-terminal domain-containing protein n=1 Tax=Aspergillus campestris (strain IBT 28561) TaxID=1392248 RepID=A0A2I1DFC1_ASPC2|nr:uncharacterized protein P168DRAFT_323668 [Aspergillus campestris IBT 28561]PKY08558.1 hypothetical protein P168DRAFT_323668 [Aspergillus campestris IBT 28561]
MPLHLLGKKSWNVYNPENIARVRRDEAQAKAREEEQERLMQEVDAERRIKILRGERPPTPPPAPRSPSPVQADRKSYAEHPRKRRRLAGENDTDRDIRFAREDAQLALARRTEPAGPSRKSDAPLEDSTGHINLFPSEEKRGRAEKNPEAEKEVKEKERRFEDQYTMRFSNAAGFRQSVGEKPWYSSSGNNAVAPESMSSKDVWGNEDVLRGEREKARMNSNDPLAAMKKGVRQLNQRNDTGLAVAEDRSRKIVLRTSNLTVHQIDGLQKGGHIGTTGDTVEKVGREIIHGIDILARRGILARRDIRIRRDIRTHIIVTIIIAVTVEVIAGLVMNPSPKRDIIIQA